MKILIVFLLVLILIELGRSAAPPQSSVLVDANPAQDLDLKDLSNG